VYTLVDRETGEHVLGVFNSAADYKAYCKENELDIGDVEVEKDRVVDPLSHALANVKSVMSRIEEEGDKVIVCLSQGKCFRSDLATMKEYKGNRKDMEKPVYYEEVREYLAKYWDTRVFQQLEADDAVALMQERALKRDPDFSTVIASIDKDLLQVPGLHYNWVNDERALITPEVGLKKRYMQVLTGDSTDNIPGIRGVGPVSARKLITEGTNEPALWDIVYSEWEAYLRSDKPKPVEDLVYDDDTGWYSYTNWKGEVVEGAEAGDFVSEVLDLVTVGGYNAEKVAKSSGEEALLDGTA
jgi:hypothetical protein